MKLGTKGKYAVMAMVDLAYYGWPDQPVCLADIAQRQALPLLYLEQLFNRLKKQHVVKSIRGKKGGYLLSKPASDIRISYILEAAGEPIQATRCSPQSDQGCLPDATRCLTHQLWRGLENQLFAYLQGISLEDVCQRKSDLQPASQLRSRCLG